MFRYLPFDASPWRVLDELMDSDRRLNRVFQAAADRSSGCYPRVNTFVGDKGAIVDVAIPGVPKDSIEVSVTGKTLRICGKEGVKGKAEFAFERSVELPFPVSDTGATAKASDGVLRITLPKAEEAKPRRIEIGQN